MILNLKINCLLISCVVSLFGAHIQGIVMLYCPRSISTVCPFRTLLQRDSNPQPIRAFSAPKGTRLFDATYKHIFIKKFSIYLFT